MSSARDLAELMRSSVRYHPTMGALHEEEEYEDDDYDSSSSDYY